jgi:preprotein translocase subunit SecG
MQSVLIVIHLMIVVVLVAVVLLQRSEGGALGIGGTSGFLTGRGQANALTRATTILAGLFFATSLSLTVFARLSQGPEVTFQSVTPVEPGSSGAAKEGEGRASLLEQLKKMEDQSSRPPALPPGVSLPGEAVPAAPAGTASKVETTPTDAGGLKLPPLKNSSTPLSTLTQAPTPSDAQGQDVPSTRALPFKPEKLPSVPPWEK